MPIQKPPSQPGCRWVENCIELCDANPVYVEEEGVRASFANYRHRKIRKIHYDHCYNADPDALKADYIIGLHRRLDVIVELKSSDRKHARDQVEATLLAWRSCPIRFRRIICLIVYGHLEGKKRKAGRLPKMTSANESMERDFLRRNKTLLLIRESGAEQFTLAGLSQHPEHR